MSQTPSEPQRPDEPQFPQPPAYAQPPAYGQPPAYLQPPAYGQPLGYPAQQPMPYGQGSDARNVLGILSLVAPFVGLSLVGVILGHLGLSAVKKGNANNRGIALTGTIVSWVFTGLGMLAVLAAIAIPIFRTQQGKAHEAAVRLDLRNLNVAVENYHVDYGRVPEFSFDGQSYHVADAVIGADTTVTDAQLFSSDGFSYCIQVEYGDGLVRSVDDLGNLGHGC